MTNQSSIAAILAIIFFIGIATWLVSSREPIALGSATAGLPASVATTSVETVGTTATMVFATSTCTSRIITTEGSPIMITFSDYAGQSPTGSLGHWQAGSTTVAYDSGLYGCGAVKVYSNPQSVITTTETR